MDTSWRKVPAIIGGLVGSIAVALLLNVTAGAIDPSRIPFILQWGWFGLAVYSPLYFIYVSPIRNWVVDSWHRAMWKWAWSAIAVGIIGVYMWCAHWAVNSAWKHLAQRQHESAKAEAPNPTPTPMVSERKAQPSPPSASVANTSRNGRPTFTESGPFTVLAGSNDYRISKGSTQQQPSEIRLYGESPAAIKAYVENGKIYVDALLDPGNGKEPLRLVHNELRDMPPRWDRNFDDSAIEVVDENLVPRFQLIYKTKLTAQLSGVFRFPDRAAVINYKNVHYFQGSSEGAVDIRRVFEYPFRLHPGAELQDESASTSGTAISPCNQQLEFSETPLGIGPPYIREVRISLKGASGFTFHTGATLDGLPEIAEPVRLQAGIGTSGPLMGATVSIGDKPLPDSIRLRFSSANKASVVCVNR